MAKFERGDIVKWPGYTDRSLNAIYIVTGWQTIDKYDVMIVDTIVDPDSRGYSRLYRFDVAIKIGHCDLP